MSQDFSKRLFTAMSQMVNPTKASTAVVPTKSGKYTYKYETLDQVLAAVRPPLFENGIGLTQGVSKSADGDSYVLSTVVFDDDNRLVLDERPIITVPDAQACGSYETYMRRYALRTAFGLAGEDDDGAATKRVKPQKAARKPTREGMIRRILAIKTELAQAGFTADELDSYMHADFGTTDLSDLTDAQMVDYGKRLAELNKRSKEQQ